MIFSNRSILPRWVAKISTGKFIFACLIVLSLSLSGCGEELSDEEARSLSGGGGGSTPAVPASTSILMIGPGLTEIGVVQTYLAPTGFLALDPFNHNGGTPGLALLQSYDTLFVWSNGAPLNDVLLGDVLADYINGGGKIVVSEYVHFGGTAGVAGRYQSEGHAPFNKNGTAPNFNLSLGTVLDPGHPIMQNVNTLGSFSNDNPTIVGGTTVIAEWNNGQPAVAFNAAGTVISLNFWAGSTSNMSGDYVTLISNAFLFAASN